MLVLLKFLYVLISINQETVLNWLGIEDPRIRDLPPADYGFDVDVSTLEPSPNVSLETFHIILDALWTKIQSGLSLTEFENMLFFLVFVRFVLVAIRYNIKTSFYITCISTLAAYLWYKHFLDLLIQYQTILVKIPITYKLGRDMTRLYKLKRSRVIISSTKWTKAIPILKQTFKGSIWNNGYLIDPISMVFSVIPESIRSETDEIYYLFYRDIGPSLFRAFRSFYREFQSLAAYTMIVRVGKPYCPYFIRWHWTFIISLTFIEQFIIPFTHRIDMYMVYRLIPKLEKTKAMGLMIRVGPIKEQIAILNGLLVAVILFHMAIITYGLLHAVCGQYFYVPSFTETTELHVGLKPKTIYSGGNAAWQGREKTDLRRVLIPWYGWFGRGTKNDNNWRIFRKLRKFLRKIFKKIVKRFKK